MHIVDLRSNRESGLLKVKRDYLILRVITSFLNDADVCIILTDSR